MRRRLLVLLLAALAATGCTTGATSPVDDPGIHGSPVPAARPDGAAYGRLMHADGTAVIGSTVTLNQPFDTNLVTGAFTVASLGLFCLLPGNDTCPHVEAAHLGDDGLWHLDADEIRSGRVLTLTGRGPAATAAGTEAAGPFTAVTVPDRRDPQRVPDLVLWEPRVRLTPTRAGVRVAWPELDGVPHGSDVRYDVYVRTTGGYDATVVQGTTARTALVPAWQMEDSAAQVSIAATTRHGGAAYVYTTRSAGVRGRALPLSRGRGCTADRHGVQVAAVKPCRLTDGDLEMHDEVRLPGECSVHRSSCRLHSHARLCVDLGHSKPISLVVVRSPFLVDGDPVELSRDARNFLRVGELPATGTESDVFPVRVTPTTSARFVCLTDPSGISGAVFQEISVW